MRVWVGARAFVTTFEKAQIVMELSMGIIPLEDNSMLCMYISYSQQ
jgi:hypothetical protein